MTSKKAEYQYETVSIGGDPDGQWRIHRSDGKVSEKSYPLAQAEGIMERGARVKFVDPPADDPKAPAPAVIDVPDDKIVEVPDGDNDDGDKGDQPEVPVFDPTSMDRSAMLDAAKAESAAKKAAMAAGDPVPPTPVLDYMNSADWKQRKDAMPKKRSGGNKGGGGGTGKPGNVRLTEDEIKVECERLVAAGYVTKAAILNQLRDEGKGTRQQRLFPIAQLVIDKAKADGKITDAPKATKAAGATKATGSRKASGSKAAATPSTKDHAKAAKAQASVQDRREQQGKATAAKRQAAKSTSGRVSPARTRKSA